MQQHEPADADTEAPVEEYVLDSTRSGLHVEEAGTPMVVDEDDEADEDDLAIVFSGLDALIDAFVEAYNARDLDALDELLAEDAELPGFGDDREGFERAVEELWERRPNSTMTRGEIEGEPVAVMWVLGDDATWWRSALVTFEPTSETELAVVELVEEGVELEQVVAEEPDTEYEEGMRWEEWEEGAE